MCVLDSQIHFYDHVKFINIYCCICLPSLPSPLPQIARLRLCPGGSATARATATSQVWLLLVAFRLLFLYVLNGSNNRLQYTQLYLYLYLELYLYLYLYVCIYLSICNIVCICGCQLPATHTKSTPQVTQGHAQSLPPAARRRHGHGHEYDLN